MTTGQEVVPEGATAAAAEPDQPAGRSRRPGYRGRDWSAWWPLAGLAAVLVVQLILSLRLARANTAFQDEALYLWAGHREWAHILHGAPLPPFPVYFSGAPVLYPPIGAVADSIGGLAAARILSTLFMLGATTLLWSAAGRLFGRRAAFFAAALFAVSGPALHLGSFATYDGLSVLLIALSAWCVVRAGDRRDATLLMAAAGLALAVANAAAYSTMLMDPVIIAMAWLTALPRPGGKPAATRPAVLFIVTAALLLAGVLIGGGDYLTGFTHTTLNRVSATDAPWSVLAHAWSWTGVILILAACGILVSAVRNRLDHCTWLLALLTAAAIAGPVEQASLHTMASLNKHVGVGAWFAAIAAGYAADQFIASAPARWSALTTGACVVALAFPAAVGATQSWQFSTDWPSAASFTSIFGGLVRGTTGRLLVEDPSIAEYYLPSGRQWQRWSSTRNIVLPSGASTGGPTSSAGVTGGGDPKAFATYIARGYWSMIALNFADTTDLDHAIAADIKANKHYHIAQVIPYGSGTYVIYRYEPGS